ncbi:PPOX class F420-dependent oxidoreductase [Tsukamurella soli]|uniref:Pyridoxamine 5'-phosphate oxidase N-terminal domain-containing protein n=1 Tax=Tsukamurella soli TaxID=644556 RepID=A0ABP8J2C5_9ACTN
MSTFDLAHARYVSVATFRKSGERVATPVWPVPLSDGRIAFATAPDAGKVRRLRNNPRVDVTECDLRGRIGPGAPTQTGQATVVTAGPEVAEVRRALRTKYGLQAVIIGIGSAIKSAVTRRQSSEAVVIITLDDAAS